MGRSRHRSHLGPMEFLLGYRRVSFPRAFLERVLSLCTKNDIYYREVTDGSEYAQLSIFFLHYRRFHRIVVAYGIPCEQCGGVGLPYLCMAHKHRLGIPLGLLLGGLLIFTSGLFVWDVRIDGEERLTEEQVILALEYCGLSVGTPLKDLDIDVIENRVLILSDDISWISINMRGTVANVEIRELNIAPIEDDAGISNIIADRSGVIERFENVRGVTVTSIGEAVSKGQLLISGILGDDLSGIGYTHAKGRVFAQCEDEIQVNIPRKYPKKVYTGEVKYEKSLIFFKKEIKFFSNYRNSYTTCDKIDMIEYLSAPLGESMPIGIRTVKYLEYTYEEAERDDTQLSDTAYYQLSDRLSQVLKDGDLLRKSVSLDINEDGCTLLCRLRFITDIAKQQPIEYSNNE